MKTLKLLIALLVICANPSYSMRGGYRPYNPPRSNPAYGRAQVTAGVLQASRMREYFSNNPDPALRGLEGFVNSDGTVDPALNDVLDYKVGKQYAEAIRQQLRY